MSYRWPVTVIHEKIGLISRLETEQVIAKYLLTVFDDLQGKRRCVKEGDACMDEYHEGRQGVERDEPRYQWVFVSFDMFAMR